jgi:hypothetical protein
LDSPYKCRGEDEEDLTAAVLAKAQSSPSTVFGLTALGKLSRRARRRDRPKTVKVKVACSRGHENIFEVPRTG